MQVGSYHRATFHLDRFLKRNEVNQPADSLQQLFVRLEEPDLVLGAAAVREAEPSLELLIAEHEATGNYQGSNKSSHSQGHLQ